ncbi:hypothetical protein EON65_48210 [archaeon]|nr:MAG: hypothetical protein EON65_48210 [archaeon]
MLLHVLVVVVVASLLLHMQRAENPADSAMTSKHRYLASTLSNWMFSPTMQRLFDNLEDYVIDPLLGQPQVESRADLNVFTSSVGNLVRKLGGFKVHAKSQDIYNKLSNIMEGYIVVVVGDYDAGKTWFINQWTGSSQPSGKDKVTEGLQVVLYGNTVVVETQGPHRTTNSTNAAAAAARDEFFSLVATRLPHHLVFVVNGMKTGSMNEILALFEQVRAFNPKIKFFLVHNLLDRSWDNEVNTYITNVVEYSFGANEQKFVVADKAYGSYWTSHDGDILHFIMARSGTVAGNKYNDNTMVVLKNLLERRGDQKRFNFMQVLLEIFESILPSVVKSPALNNTGVVVVYDPNAFEEAVTETTSNNGKVDSRVRVSKANPGNSFVSFFSNFLLKNANMLYNTLHRTKPAELQEDVEKDLKYFQQFSPDRFGLEIVKLDDLNIADATACPKDIVCHRIVLKDVSVDTLEYLPLDKSTMTIPDYNFRPTYSVLENENNGDITVIVDVLDARFVVSTDNKDSITIFGGRLPPAPVQQLLSANSSETKIIYSTKGARYSPFSLTIHLNNYFRQDLSKYTKEFDNGVLTLTWTASSSL